jgi:hypothetical protein
VHPLVLLMSRTYRRYPVRLRRRFDSLSAVLGHVTVADSLHHLAGLRRSRVVHSRAAATPVQASRSGGSTWGLIGL